MGERSQGSLSPVWTNKPISCPLAVGKETSNGSQFQFQLWLVFARSLRCPSWKEACGCLTGEHQLIASQPCGVPQPGAAAYKAHLPHGKQRAEGVCTSPRLSGVWCLVYHCTLLEGSPQLCSFNQCGRCGASFQKAKGPSTVGTLTCEAFF